MSNIVIDESFEDQRVLPTNGKFKASLFANLMTLLTFFLVIVIIILFLFGVVATVFTVSEFRKVAARGYPKVPLEDMSKDYDPRKYLDAAQTQENPDYNRRIDYQFWLRWSSALYIISIILFFPTRWLFRTYGRQSVIINDEGIKVSKFPRKRVVTPWEGVLDITVKQSSSIFSVLNKKLSKITIYTMDQSISIENMTLSNRYILTDQLREFGDSLEERVIDFGYGASFSIVWRRIKRSKVGVLGAMLVVFFIGIAIFASAITLVVPHDTLEAQSRQKTLFGFWNPIYTNVDFKNQPPSSEHWFGTNGNGSDIFSRLLFGAFYSILIGVVSTFISVTLGFFIGSASGYLGGTTDQIIQRITEVINSMPGFPLLLLISAVFYQIFQEVTIEGAYYLTVYAIFSLIAWGGTARIIRSEVLALKNSEFVQAERVLGASHWRIITKHIMPNSMSTVIIFFTLGIAGGISGVAALAYLGFGSGSTLVWGSDLALAVKNNTTQFWWGTTFISLSLFLLVLGFNLLGDVLRDALDPKLKN